MCCARYLCGKNLHCLSREIKWWRDFSSPFHVPNDVAYKHKTSARCRASRSVKQSRTLAIVVVQGHQFCLKMADTKPNPCIVKWNLFTCYLNSPPLGRAAFGSTPFGRAIILAFLQIFINKHRPSYINSHTSYQLIHTFMDVTASSYQLKETFNICHSEFLLRYIKIYFQFVWFLKTEMAHIIEIFYCRKQRTPLLEFNAISADDLVMERAMSSAAMVST